MLFVRIAIAVILLAALAAACWLPGREETLGSYATSLSGRTRGQRLNASRAARAVDGVTLEPGAVFSFNKTVGSWTAERGYVPAPVSYDGELVVDWGGGVCQTSTTLYNAALLAGLQVLERHRHTWAPKYVPPGRDAAVAQYDIDLRLRNPYPWPVRVVSVSSEGSIGFRIIGRERGPMAQLTGETTALTPPITVTKFDARLSHGRRRVLTRGRPGFRVAVTRTFVRGSRAGQRELVSQDTYPVMNTVIAVGH
jgi:vancomycin resistance protein YoaR